MKSYYRLEIHDDSLDPLDLFVLDAAARPDVEAALLERIGSSVGLYNLLFHSAEIRLSTYRGARRVASLDLLPRIVLQLPALKVKDSAMDVALRFSGPSEATLTGPGGEPLPDDPAWEDVDWLGPLLQRSFSGEMVRDRDFRVDPIDLSDLPALAGGALT